MKIKTIQSTINDKFDSWVKSIDDEKVRELVENNTLVTGGCIASMLLQEPVNDFDLYFRDFETTKAVAEYYVNKYLEGEKKEGEVFNPEEESYLRVVAEDGRVKVMVQSSGVASVDEGTYEYFENDMVGDSTEAFVRSTFSSACEGKEFKKLSECKKYKPLLLTDNAITLSGDIQLVLRFYGDPKKIHSFYDFVHCTNYWTSWDRELVTNKRALESVLTKELHYMGSQYPICSIIRIRKFIKRDWTINAGQILKMVSQVAAMCTPQTLQEYHNMGTSLGFTPDTSSTPPSDLTGSAWGTNHNNKDYNDSEEDPEVSRGQEPAPWSVPGANNWLLSNVELLSDQLVGVDQAYFKEIISILKRDSQQEGKTIDSSYLSKLIDEIF